MALSAEQETHTGCVSRCLKARLITDGVPPGESQVREIEIKWFGQVFSDPA